MADATDLKSVGILPYGFESRPRHYFFTSGKTYRESSYRKKQKNSKECFVMNVLLHVNYYEGPGRLQEFLNTAVKYGYNGVELRGKYTQGDMDQTQYRAVVEEFKQKHPEMQIVFGQMVPFCRGSEEEVKQGTEFFMDLLSWASKACGSTLFNAFTGPVVPAGVVWTESDKIGSGGAEESDYIKSAEGLRILGKEAARYSIRLALETHCGYLHDLADPGMKLLEMAGCDNVGLNHDQGNIILHPHGNSIKDYFEKAGARTYYAHLKNLHKVAGQNGGGYAVCRLSDGSINTRLVVSNLLQLKNLDTFAVEYPCPGDGIYAAKKDIEYIRELLADLQGA